MLGLGQLSVPGPGTLCRVLALSVSGLNALCDGARRFVCQVSEPGTLCVGRFPALSLSGPALSVSGPGCRPFLCRAHPRATHPVPSSDPRATHPARRVPFFQERNPNLTVWGIMHICTIQIYEVVYVLMFWYVVCSLVRVFAVCMCLYVLIYICVALLIQVLIVVVYVSGV